MTAHRYHSTRAHHDITGVRRSGLTWADKYGSRIVPMADDIRFISREAKKRGNSGDAQADKAQPGYGFGMTIVLGGISTLVLVGLVVSLFF